MPVSDVAGPPLAEAQDLELGLRTNTRRLSTDVTVFAMKKRDSVFRDAEGFNVSGARTRHEGIETSVDWRPNEQFSVALDASYARHRYDFDTVAARGETFASGRDVDTAPRWLGSLELAWTPTDRVDVGLQLTSIGEYYLDAENQFRYPGHSIANLRTTVDISTRLRLVMRLNNIMDRDIADRADYAFGNFRYFPGRGREFFAEIQYLTTKESL